MCGASEHLKGVEHHRSLVWTLSRVGGLVLLMLSCGPIAACGRQPGAGPAERASVNARPPTTQPAGSTASRPTASQPVDWPRPRLDDRQAEREYMVRYHIDARGVRDPLVLLAMRNVPREWFMPVYQQRHAYEDRPLSIGKGQTISQPYIVAYMTDELLLTGTEKVLEIGTGSGYQAAILGELAAQVITVERLPQLAEEACAILSELGYNNVQVKVGDGTLGWPGEAPYDAIIVTAAGPEVPEPLQQQLADGGRLLAPIGPRWTQQLVRIRRAGAQFHTESLLGVAFVPLIGEHGWHDRGSISRGKEGTL